MSRTIVAGILLLGGALCRSRDVLISQHALFATTAGTRPLPAVGLASTRGSR
jgi:hypothetical protein